MQALFREIGPVLPVHGKVTLVFDDCFYRKCKAARDLMLSALEQSILSLGGVDEVQFLIEGSAEPDGYR